MIGSPHHIITQHIPCAPITLTSPYLSSRALRVNTFHHVDAHPRLPTNTPHLPKLIHCPHPLDPAIPLFPSHRPHARQLVHNPRVSNVIHPPGHSPGVHHHRRPPHREAPNHQQQHKAEHPHSSPGARPVGNPRLRRPEGHVGEEYGEELGEEGREGREGEERVAAAEGGGEGGEGVCGRAGKDGAGGLRCFG